MSFKQQRINLASHLAYRYDMLGFNSPREDKTRPTCNAHLKWMLLRCLRFDMPGALQFVQGALIAKGMVTPEQIEVFKRRRFRKTLEACVGPRDL